MRRMAQLKLTPRVTISLGVLFVLLSALHAYAKEDTLFDKEVTSIGTSKSADASRTTEIRRTLISVGGRLGAPLGQNTYFIYGAEYEGQMVDYNHFMPVMVGGNLTREADLPTNLHALEVIGGLHWILSGGWSATMELRPGLHSDFNEIDLDDVTFIATVLAERRYGARNRWGLGMAYTDLLGRRYPVPILRLFWYPTERWFVEATLPKDLDLGFRVSQNFTIGLEGRLRGNRYRLAEGPPFEGGVLESFQIRVGPLLNYELWRRKDDRFKANFRVSGGLVTAQQFRIRDKDNDHTLLGGDLGHASYLAVNLYVTF